MASVLYAVAVRSPNGRQFRPPTPTDLAGIQAAEDELEQLLPEWEANDVIPREEIPDGSKTSEPLRYGLRYWRDMFSARQLLVHGSFVDEFRNLIPEVRAAIEDQARADAVLAELAMIQGKAVNWNCNLSTWMIGREQVRAKFDMHNHAFKWTFTEFDAGRELYPWCFRRGVLRAYPALARTLNATSDGMDLDSLTYPVPGSITVSQGNAGNMEWLDDDSVQLICIDPPYYGNVMYAELADFFYVWERRTLSALWPELFNDALTNKDDEAVKNVARFAHAGKQRERLATMDYERKMTAIFGECRRILTDDGVMTVMFTHKEAGAWDTLGQSLLESGFTIEASWPVPTESQHSLHIAKKNSAESTIFLVCRKRLARLGAGKVYFEDIESDVRAAARASYSAMTEMGLSGVDRLLSTYGPALSVLSENWPVYSSQADESTGQSRLLRPDEALITAQEEVGRLQLARLVATHFEFDPITDFWLLAWDTFQAREFPFDEGRKLCLAVGGVDVEDLARAKIIGKKSGTVVLVEPKGRVRRDADSVLPGVNRDRTSFPTLVDALHTALYVLDLDGSAAARSWLDQRKLTVDARFTALVESALKAVPRTRDKGDLTVVEADLLERLSIAAFPDMEISEDDRTTVEGQLTLGYE
jgi:adenine-specific DNA methylase